MSKKKGLSLDEKRVKVLELFHESRDVWQLKDMEKAAPKRGVIQQSVKEVVQALVDDNEVHQEKIGSSNFFWAFPGEHAAKVRKDLEAAQRTSEDLVRQRGTLEARLETSRAAKGSSAARAGNLQRLGELEDAMQGRTKQLAQYSASDPQRYEAMREAHIVAKEAVNRWTENLETLHDYLKGQMAGAEDQVKQLFSQHGALNLDYLD